MKKKTFRGPFPWHEGTFMQSLRNCQAPGPGPGQVQVRFRSGSGQGPGQGPGQCSSLKQTQN